MHINWQSFRQLHAITIYIFRLRYLWRCPFAFCFPLLISLCSPFRSLLLTWNPPCCDRIRPTWSQVARKLISSFPSLPIPSPFRNPDPLGFSRVKCASTKTTSQHWLTSPEHIYCIYKYIYIFVYVYRYMWRRQRGSEHRSKSATCIVINPCMVLAKWREI
jgi:hypothetical protein